jgi:segregation and condensation protein B
LFNAQKPLSPQELKTILVTTAEQAEESYSKAFKKTPAENIVAALEQLQREHGEAQHTFRLACVAGAWQFVTQPDYAPWLRTLVGQKMRPPRLSQPALETLAIIAYRQPVTRAEVEQVRGVAVDGVLQTLLERGLVEQTGRAEVPGRPALYSTTTQFLEYFGLGRLEDLPAADELRRIQVEKPEGLLTVEPGLATAPPQQLTLQEMPPAPPAEPATGSPGAPPASAPTPVDNPETAGENPAP